MSGTLPVVAADEVILFSARIGKARHIAVGIERVIGEVPLGEVCRSVRHPFFDKVRLRRRHSAVRPAVVEGRLVSHGRDFASQVVLGRERVRGVCSRARERRSSALRRDVLRQAPRFAVQVRPVERRGNVAANGMILLIFRRVRREAARGGPSVSGLPLHVLYVVWVERRDRGVRLRLSAEQRESDKREGRRRIYFFHGKRCRPFRNLKKNYKISAPPPQDADAPRAWPRENFHRPRPRAMARRKNSC